MDDPIRRAMSIPLDEALLPALGRVTWAAIRLHHGVRDALRHIHGPAEDYFDGTLGSVVADLKKAARRRVAEPDRTKLLEWCTQVAVPAVEKRNGVLHAIAYTDPDGRQALQGSRPGRPPRYLEPELLTVAGELDLASLYLPRGPYKLSP